MLRKMIAWAAGGAFFVLVAIVLLLLSSPKNGGRSRSQNIPLDQPLSVDEVINHIEKYAGFVGVEGKVQEVDSGGYLRLGNEDGSLTLPVDYRGILPLKGSRVIAYGRILMDEGERYVFEASIVKAK